VIHIILSFSAQWYCGGYGFPGSLLHSTKTIENMSVLILLRNFLHLRTWIESTEGHVTVIYSLSCQASMWDGQRSISIVGDQKIGPEEQELNLEGRKRLGTM
jgi:hypothetical protein